MRSLLPALAAILVVTACAEKPQPAPLPKIVRTLVVGTADAGGARSFSGEVRARYEIPLGFRIGGKIALRLVDAGAQVKAGQLLARLDPADAVLQANQAAINRRIADADAHRYRDLRAKNFVSQAALEAKENALAVADAQAGLAQNQSAYTALVADHAGVITAVLAEPGQVVGAGQPVVRLARDGEREVAIALPETEVAGLKPGVDAEIKLWSGGKTYRGRLRELAPAADAATRTYAARVSVLDADEALALGMTASVSFNGAKAAAKTLVVPLAALYQQGSEPAVWVVGSDQAVALRKLRVTKYTDAGAVVAEGLTAGERIVAAGAHKLTANEKVRLADTKGATQ